MAQLDLSPTVVQPVGPKILSDERCQLALAILRETDHPLALADLAGDIIRAEQEIPVGKPDFETIYQCQLMLYHQHLPKLEDAGFIHFNPETRTVRYRENESLEVELSAASTDWEQ